MSGLTPRGRADEVRKELAEAIYDGGESRWSDAQDYAADQVPEGAMILTADEVEQVRQALRRGGCDEGYGALALFGAS